MTQPATDLPQPPWPGYPPAAPWAAPGAPQPPHPYPTPYAPVPGPHEGHAGVGSALLAAGTPLPFADGTTRVIRYDFLSMLVIEEEHGSIKALLDKVQTPDLPAGHVASEWDSLATPIMSVCADLIRYGLFDPELSRHMTRREVAALLIPSMLGEYVEAASTAIAQAFGPKPPPSKEGGEPADPTTGSTGSAGGASPPASTPGTGSGA